MEKFICVKKYFCNKLSSLSKGQWLVSLLGVFLVVIGVVLSLPNAFADLVPVSSVTITSEKLDYTKKVPGSFNIEKSAKWIGKGKARITFDVDTIMKAEEKYRDIIFVLDISGSMDGDKLTRVKQDSIDLINTLLSDSNNRAALITFESASQLVLPLTNNKDELTSTINNLTTTGCTNYYQALVNVDTILKTYQKAHNRDLIVLFLTDGYPNVDVPNEKGQYSYLRKQYPYITINGVQYEMGSDILEPIKKVSDQQFIANMTNLSNILFKASVAAATYDNYQITDYINNDYFEIESVDNIITTVGEVDLEYVNNVPKVTWNIKNLRTGSHAQLMIDVKLKDDYLNIGGLYPTNKSEDVNLKINDIEENITSKKSPILSSHYQVVYDANIPDGCTLEENVPDTESKWVFETVEIKNKKLTCNNNYQFKGWHIVTKDVKKINDNYFEMPGEDVVLRAEWTKFTVSKAIDGEVYVAPPSIIKRVTDVQNTEIWKYKSTITKIVFENRITDKEDAIETFDISDKKNESVIAHVVPNDDGSTYTAYIQGNEKVIANENSSNLFSNFRKLVSIEGLEYFDTSQVTNMNRMFYYSMGLENLDLSYFNTSNVTNMGGMFMHCQSLTNLNLSNFDTGKVTNMGGMFSECSSLTSIDLHGFNTSKATYMSNMFDECSSLTSLDLSSFNTSNVTNMAQMFYKCSNLEILNISSFDTGNVTGMSQMFSGCSKLLSLDLSGFSTGKVTKMYEMFYGCRSLTSLDLSIFDTRNVTDMEKIFCSCLGLTSLDISSFNTLNVVNMKDMFSGCSNLTGLDVSSFDTSQVANMSRMFYDCSSLTNLDLSSFSTGKVTNMSSMFYKCNKLVSLDMRHFDTSKVSTMEYMFSSASNITSLNLHNFNTARVSNMKDMFSGCRSLTSLDVSSFNTSNVTSMYNMFSGCSSLANLDLNSFDTSKVTNMSYMFSGCGWLVSLNIGNFNTSKVTNMIRMFNGCSNLVNLDLSNFDTSQLKYMTEMFNNCGNLTTTITIRNVGESYDKMFLSSAFVDSSQITVNYTNETSEFVDEILKTKSSNSNVIKGVLVTS